MKGAISDKTVGDLSLRARARRLDVLRKTHWDLISREGRRARARGYRDGGARERKFSVENSSKVVAPQPSLRNEVYPARYRALCRSTGEGRQGRREEEGRVWGDARGDPFSKAQPRDAIRSARATTTRASTRACCFLRVDSPVRRERTMRALRLARFSFSPIFINPDLRFSLPSLSFSLSLSSRKSNNISRQLNIANDLVRLREPGSW